MQRRVRLSRSHASVPSFLNATAFGLLQGCRGAPAAAGRAVPPCPRLPGGAAAAPPAAAPRSPAASRSDSYRTLRLFRPSLPVSCQPGRDIPSGDLGDYVSPEKRAVDHANCFRIPIKLRFLPTQGTGREGEKEKRKAVIVPDD